MTTLPAPRSQTGLAEIARLTEEAKGYLAQAKAGNTLRAYQADWRHFDDWCRRHGAASMPALPETLCLYLSDIARTHRTSTLQRRLTAIGQAHHAAGQESPTKHAAVKAVWAGIRRVKGTHQEGKTPTVTADIAAMVALLPDSLLGTRGRALLLLGFAAALRRSELVALNVQDLLKTSGSLVTQIAFPIDPLESSFHSPEKETGPQADQDEWLYT